MNHIISNGSSLIQVKLQPIINSNRLGINNNKIPCILQWLCTNMDSRIKIQYADNHNSNDAYNSAECVFKVWNWRVSGSDDNTIIYYYGEVIMWEQGEDNDETVSIGGMINKLFKLNIFGNFAHWQLVSFSSLLLGW